MASSSGRGAERRRVSGEVVLAQGHQPVGQRGPVTADQGTSTWSSSSNAASAASSSNRSSGTATGGPSGASSASATVANPTVSNCPYSAPPPKRSGDSCRNASRCRGGLGLLQPGRLLLADRVPDVGHDRVGLPVTVGHHRVGHQPVQVGTDADVDPTRGAADRRHLRPDSHRSPSPANVAGMSASISTAPRISRASVWVQRSWCCSHTCNDIPPVTSARSSAALAATSSPTSSPHLPVPALGDPDHLVEPARRARDRPDRVGARPSPQPGPAT